MDAARAVDELISLGYDTWLCNAGGIVYFYPVHEPYQRTARTLAERPSGDLVGDVVEAAHERDVRVLSRFDFSRLPSDIVADHPEWAFVDRDGEWYTEDGLTAICPRSDYHEVLVPQILDDFVRRYPVDGVFFNWLQFTEVAYSGAYKGVCRCDRCRAAFQQAHPGHAHPRGVGEEGYDLWLPVAFARLTELAERYSEVVNAVRPGTPLMLADVRMDIAFLETNSSLGHGDKWWPHTPSELASVNRISDPAVPALVHSSVNMGLPYRQIAEEPAQFRRYMAQALSRGALPSSVAIGVADAERFPCLRAGAELFGFLRLHHDLYAGFEPAARVALVRPRGGTALSELQSRDDFSEYRGLYTALQEAHIAFDVIGLQYQEQLVRRDVLGRYRVVVVPGTAGMDAPLRHALDDFVRTGGALLLTGDAFDDQEPGTAATAVLDAAPAVRRTARLSGVARLGGRYVGPADGSTAEPLHPVVGHFSLAEWRAESIPGRLVLSTQTPFGPPEITGGNAPADDAPALVRARFGAGRVVQFPWSVGTTSHESGLSALDRVVSDEVASLLGDDTVVTANLPASVELTLGRAEGGWVIHLINHTSGRGDRVREPLPVHGQLVLGPRLRGARSARALVADRVLPIAEGMRIDVDLNGVLEVIRID
ncbi:alpha-amylase family protein [Amycolatopsis mediterranei]|uniref:alpha-amylase family protein n=1 Tax=Amycolatopsis mediterranei TaxID=33910 RepID=UPI0033275709